MKDLTKIKTPVGLLKTKVQKALRAHGGPYECYVDGQWSHCYPTWNKDYAYRVKPADPITLTTVVGDGIIDNTATLQAAVDEAGALPVGQFYKKDYPLAAQVQRDPHPIFAAVKEWQETYCIAGAARQMQACRNLLSIKVPE